MSKNRYLQFAIKEGLIVKNGDVLRITAKGKQLLKFLNDPPKDEEK